MATAGVISGLNSRQGQHGGTENLALSAGSEDKASQ